MAGGGRRLVSRQVGWEGIRGAVMSVCVDCLGEMLDSEAKRSFVCPTCQRLRGRPPMPVQDGRTDKQRRPVVYQMKAAFSYPEQE